MVFKGDQEIGNIGEQKKSRKKSRTKVNITQGRTKIMHGLTKIMHGRTKIIQDRTFIILYTYTNTNYKVLIRLRSFHIAMRNCARVLDATMAFSASNDSLRSSVILD